MSWPFAELLGMRAKSIGDGRARFVYSLADSAMGAALFSQLDPGEQCATPEAKMSYLVSVTGGAIAVEAAVIQRTKHIGVT